MTENLTFNLRHSTREAFCAEIHPGDKSCGSDDPPHLTPTGDATLTISGPADLVRRAAAVALPFFSAVLDPQEASRGEVRALMEQKPAPVHLSHRCRSMANGDLKCLECGMIVKQTLYESATIPGAAPCEPKKALDKSSGGD